MGEESNRGSEGGVAGRGVEGRGGVERVNGGSMRRVCLHWRLVSRFTLSTQSRMCAGLSCQALCRLRSLVAALVAGASWGAAGRR